MRPTNRHYASQSQRDIVKLASYRYTYLSVHLISWILSYSTRVAILTFNTSYLKPKTPLLFHTLRKFFIALIDSSAALSINESLDVVQPPSVLSLLLDVHVVGNKDSKGLGDATLLEEALHEDLEVVVEAAEGGPGVDISTLLSGVGALDLGNRGVGVVEEVLDNNVSFLSAGIDIQGSRGLARLLDNN